MENVLMVSDAVDVIKFTNIEFGNVRIVMENNKVPVFCLSDVCKVLELRVDNVVSRLKEGDPYIKGVSSTDNFKDKNTGIDGISVHKIPDKNNHLQSMYFVNEDSLYDVIFDSRKPKAKKFRKWITRDVLPSIRKFGAYIDVDHPTIRQLSKDIRDDLESAINLLIKLKSDEVIELGSGNYMAGRNFVYSMITSFANNFAGIEKGERDKVDTLKLINIIRAENASILCILKSVTKKRNLVDTINYIGHYINTYLGEMEHVEEFAKAA